MVTAANFNTLTLDAKGHQIWNNSTFLHVREDKHCRYNLFYINNYYVELVYNKENNEIENICGLVSDATIALYLETIDINALMN